MRMDMTLELNDGTMLDGSYAIKSGGVLWVYVYAEIGFVELFQLLNDPEKTGTITARQGGVTNEYQGFMELFCIRKEDGGFISAGLRK